MQFIDRFGVTPPTVGGLSYPKNQSVIGRKLLGDVFPSNRTVNSSAQVSDLLPMVLSGTLSSLRAIWLGVWNVVPLLQGAFTVPLVQTAPELVACAPIATSSGLFPTEPNSPQMNVVFSAGVYELQLDGVIASLLYIVVKPLVALGSVVPPFW